jgi:hypothetical protein
VKSPKCCGKIMLAFSCVKLMNTDLVFFQCKYCGELKEMEVKR